MSPVTAALLAGLAGLLAGSFANVVIHRVPRRESLVRPGSRCPACQQPIAWRDNVPLLGWLLLRGRCRRCRARISARYPAVELAVATLTYVYADSTAVVGPLATHAEPHCYDLCEEHANRLTAPRGPTPGASGSASPPSSDIDGVHQDGTRPSKPLDTHDIPLPNPVLLASGDDHGFHGAASSEKRR